MAKFFKSDKWKKGLTAGLCIALSATLSLGILSACGKKPAEDDDEEDTTLPTDTQLIKNGDFEFYNEMTKEEQDERRTFINSPTSWSASAESPSSDSSSGIVNAEDWAYMTKSAKSLIREEDRTTTNDDGETVPAEPGDVEFSDEAKKFALDNWDEASLYDRLEFYDFFDIDADSGFDKYDDYKYSIDFDDVRYLAEEAGEELGLHYAEGEDEAGSGVLMIHNHHYTSTEQVSGTAKYYTSSTDVTLNAGTAAKVSVWVKTIGLKHYDKVDVTKRAGAYIAVTNNVGSTALDQFQINDIITANAADQTTNNGWQQFTVYIRANTFATTTFRIVLGLGRGTSDDRYEAVDGIALFDDLECELIEDAEFHSAVYGADKVLPESGHISKLDDKDLARKFYSTSRTDPAKDGKGVYDENTNYALDLKAEFEEYELASAEIGLTEEVSGSRTYTSADIDKKLFDNTKEGTTPTQYQSVLGKFDLNGLKDAAEAGGSVKNGYLKTIVDNDFAKFPFANEDNIIMLLSTNGAAYTAKLPKIDVASNSRMLVSFWVKTSSILSGRSGAGATLVDGENKVSINPFDSTAVPTVDVGDSVKDIWDGWVQCFFFVENDSDEVKSFTLELTYGPTAIASSTASSYCDGYAAFANFEIKTDLTRAQYNYAATGTYAQKTTLTGASTDPSVFDSAAASGNTLEEGLARPANYTGALAGSDVLVAGSETKNPTIKELNKEGIYTGLLSSEFADNYANTTEDKDGTAYGDGNPLPAWKSFLSTEAGAASVGETWWKNLFGSKNGATANAAYQPLVLLNTNAAGTTHASYGFYAAKATLSANSATKISVRVKVKSGTTAYLYLIDVSGKASEGYNSGLKATLPAVTYWYDDDGNIVNMDPDDDEFDEKGKILYELQENGLYKNAQDTTDTALYANFANFEKDDEGNYVTTAGTPVFYYDSETDAYYAYRDEEKDDTYTYRTKVQPLPDKGDFVRYNYSEYPEAVIAIKGDDFGGEWVTVSFYVQTGTEEKDYRLELWAGQRDYVEGDTSKTGFPGQGYVFFDRCNITTVSNYGALLSETADTMLAYKDGDAYPFRDADDSEKLAEGFGRYYTFTIYDSPDFIRYDKTQDENGDGDPWRNYKQSEQLEKLSYLSCVDKDGSVLGTAFPTVSVYMDYSVSEQNLDTFKAPSLNDETDDDDSGDDSTTTTTGESGNIWLYLASALLAFALLFTIGAIVFRKLWSKRKKSVKVKQPKQPHAPKKAKKQPEAPAKEETPAETPDENDPYNE